MENVNFKKNKELLDLIDNLENITKFKSCKIKNLKKELINYSIYIFKMFNEINYSNIENKHIISQLNNLYLNFKNKLEIFYNLLKIFLEKNSNLKYKSKNLKKEINNLDKIIFNREKELKNILIVLNEIENWKLEHQDEKNKYINNNNILKNKIKELDNKNIIIKNKYKKLKSDVSIIKQNNKNNIDTKNKYKIQIKELKSKWEKNILNNNDLIHLKKLNNKLIEENKNLKESLSQKLVTINEWNNKVNIEKDLNKKFTIINSNDFNDLNEIRNKKNTTTTEEEFGFENDFNNLLNSKNSFFNDLNNSTFFYKENNQTINIDIKNENNNEKEINELKKNNEKEINELKKNNELLNKNYLNLIENFNNYKIKFGDELIKKDKIIIKLKNELKNK